MVGGVRDVVVGDGWTDLGFSPDALAVACLFLYAALGQSCWLRMR